jgi:hypothetical protein
LADRAGTADPQGAAIDSWILSGHARGPRFYLRHLRANARTAIVVDDLDTADGWRPSGILIKGDTRFHETGR